MICNDRRTPVTILVGIIFRGCASVDARVLLGKRSSAELRLAGAGRRRLGRPRPCALAAVIGLLTATLLSGCHSSGPIGIDPPDRSFAGLDAILNSLPADGTLDIFLVHGMRADAPQLYVAEIAAVSQRLHLKAPDGSSATPTTAAPIKLVAAVPTVTLDGVTVFDASNWDAYRPQYSVVPLVDTTGKKHVNFYRFEYWQALAYMKCRYIIAPDTRVVGETSRSKYCDDAPYADPAGSRLSSKPDVGNRVLKTEIMEWGLADATIATSAYRVVLRQAVREMLANALAQARTRAGLSADPSDASANTELARIASSNRTRFAFISESLGSYVIHDSLAQSLSGSGTAISERRALAPDEHARRLEAIAPIVVVCGASQVHMFANQLALLRFSELKVSSPSEGPVAPDVVVESGSVEDGVAGRSHFFRGCPTPSATSGASVSPGGFGAQEVIAYHEPNDLLSYYTSDRPGDVGSANRNTTNVVVPYTSQWIWFLLADPIKAHTDQPRQAAVMDMVVCGHSPDSDPRCPE